MKRTLLLAAILAAPLLLPAQALDPATLPPQARKALESCAVLIRVTTMLPTEQGPAPHRFCGTGTVVARTSRVLTTIRVVRPIAVMPGEPFTEGATMSSMTASIPVPNWSTDAIKNDLSALEQDTGSLPGIGRYRAIADLHEGEMLYALGNQLCDGWAYTAGQSFRVLDPDNVADPAERMKQLKQIDTVVQSLGGGAEGVRYDQMIMTTQGFLPPGSSGGPVVDEEGRLVGIALGSVQDYGIVVPLKPVMKALGRGEPKTTPPRGMEPEEAAAPAATPASTKSTEEMGEEEKQMKDLFDNMETTPGKKPG